MNSLIFWAKREIAFPTTLHKRIPFQTVLKERLLYFNTIILKELKIRFRENKTEVKVLWCKNNQ